MERGPAELEAALGCTSAIIWVFDAAGRCLLCTGGGLAAIGLAPEQFQGRDFLELYPADTLPGTYIRRVLAGESFVTDYEREPGTVVQTSYHPRLDEEGTCVGAIALSVDVTHRREREDEGHRGAVLAQISRALTDHARQSPEALAQAVASTLTTHLGGTALVLEFDETGLFTDSFALAGPDPEVVEAVRTAVPLWRTLLGWSMGEQTLIEGKPVVISTLPPELLRLMDERLGAELAQRLQLRALMVAPTRDAGRVNGVIVVLRGPADPAPTDRECELLLEIADRAGLALANARLLQTAQQLTADRRALLGHLIDAEEGERRRIAHDIHDDTIQVLAAVDLRLQLLMRKMSAKPGCEPEMEVLDALRESTQAATSRLRRLLFELQPPALETAGVGAALRQLASDLFADSGVACTVTDELASVPDERTASVLFRVGKEALTNARKHAHATTVQVTLWDDDSGVRLSVVDDGIGLPANDVRPDKWPHLGLETMRDRAHLAGGTLTLRGSAQEGTTVDMWLPSIKPAH